MAKGKFSSRANVKPKPMVLVVPVPHLFTPSHAQVHVKVLIDADCEPFVTEGCVSVK